MGFISKSYLSTQFENFAARIATVFAKKSELNDKQPKGNYMVSAERGSGPPITIDELYAQLKGTTGGGGSCYIGKKDSGIGSEITPGWHNYIYSPHRTGVGGGDNPENGTILLFPMNFSGISYIIRCSSAEVKEVKQIITEHQDISSKVNSTEDGANALLSKLTFWSATPTDDTYFIRQDTGGTNMFGRVKFSTIWSYIKGKTDSLYSLIGHKHTKADITDFPTSLPANGGNSNTVNNHTVNADVPSDAKFTDTIVDISGKLDMFTNDGIASCTGNGTYTYFKVATLTINTTYINAPIVFELSGRGKPLSLLTVMFNSANDTDPELIWFNSNNDSEFWIKKTATSTWAIYGKYNEVWGSYTLHRITGRGTNNGVTVTVNMTNVDGLPNHCQQITYGGNVNYAKNSGTVNGHSVNADVPSGAKFTDTNTITRVGTSSLDLASGDIIITSDGNTTIKKVDGVIRIGATDTWRPIGTGAWDAAAGDHTHSGYGTTLSLDGGILKLANGSTGIGSGIYTTTAYDDPSTEGMENVLITLKSTHDMMVDIRKNYAEKDHNHDTVYQPKGNYITTDGGVTVYGAINFFGTEQRFCPWGESYNDPMYGYPAAIKGSGTSAFQNIYLKDGIRPSGASTSVYPVVYKETGNWENFDFTTNYGTWNATIHKYVKQGDLVICEACVNRLSGTTSSSVVLTIKEYYPIPFTSSQLISATAYQPYVGYRTGTPQLDGKITFSNITSDDGVPPVFVNIVYRVS